MDKKYLERIDSSTKEIMKDPNYDPERGCIVLTIRPYKWDRTYSDQRSKKQMIKAAEIERRRKRIQNKIDEARAMQIKMFNMDGII